MSSLAEIAPDIRVRGDHVNDERQHWEMAGGGYSIYWPDIDEDLSTEGLLRGAPAPRG